VNPRVRAHRQRIEAKLVGYLDSMLRFFDKFWQNILAILTQNDFFDNFCKYFEDFDSKYVHTAIYAR
jgi:hypothetical protein